jgi:hypothetical protein
VRKRRAWGWAAGALVVVVLFVIYWRESLSAAASSDSAATALQAWDMLHGNWLLHGWWMSDVSFYTTEVPQYALVEMGLGLGPAVVHVAAAMTYTLMVVLAALVAKGRTRRGEVRRDGRIRALLAAGIVSSPQVSGAWILLLGPDHTGTMVPVLATWLLIDRMPPDYRGTRWLKPALVCVLLTWIMVADSIVLLTCIAPLIVAAVSRAAVARGRGEPLASKADELSLAVAAVVAAGLGTVAPRVIVALGGYQVQGLVTQTMPLSQLPHDAWNTLQAVLELFGADVIGVHPAFAYVLVALHIAGVLLAVLGLYFALSGFFRQDGILVPALAVAIVLSLGAFLVSGHSRNLSAIRELVAVMPLGAVLAGRMLAAPLLRLWHRLRVRPALMAVLVPVPVLVAGGYLAAMVYGAAQPAVPAVNQGLAAWLTDHQLTDGLAGYWQANSVTLDTGGRVRVSGVTVGPDGKVAPYYWETDTSGYDPSLRDVTFVITGAPRATGTRPGLAAAAERTFGPPGHVYHTQGYTIMVWTRNLLRYLR